MLKMIKTTTLTTLAGLTLAAGISTQANAATTQITGPIIAQTAEFTQNNDQLFDSILESQIVGNADNLDSDLADVTLVANRRGFRGRRGFSSRRGFRSRGFSSRRGFNRGFNRGFGHSNFDHGFGYSKFDHGFGHSGFKKKGFSSRGGFGKRSFKKKGFKGKF